MAFRNSSGLLLSAVAAFALASCSGASDEQAAEQPDTQQAAPAGAKAAASATSALKQGDWVLAPWRNSVNLFPGVIAANTGNELTIRFDDGTTDTRKVSEVRVFDWKTDTGIECQWTDGGWYNATIMSLADDGFTMRVRYDDDGVEQDTNTGKCRTRV
jgi:hypothetical protein